ncbi:MAG: molybdate ABC transporter substrate-binding protein, partial [Gammaproteobacteria bacterium]
SSASSGTLYAQILSGAPFDVFLSADCARPSELVDLGRTVSGTRFTYAVGKLALWTPGHRHPDAAWLRFPKGRLALANPEFAPYGRAAADTLGALGVMNDWQGHVVLGNNVSQAMQFAVSGAVSGAFVAKSQLLAHDVPQEFWWEIPERFYADIRQQAVVLRSATDVAAARTLVDFLKGPLARERIEAAGYETPSYDALDEVRCGGR